MKFNTKLPEVLKPHYLKELLSYQEELQKDNLQKAWQHLERAHIIGQSFPFQHSYVHWKMLQFGFRIKSTKEIIGQIPRLVFGGVKSFVGKVPVGNTGGANVPPLKSLPLAPELEQLLSKASIVRR
jgi:hypothetical protein